jgi:hypothetical protein
MRKTFGILTLMLCATPMIYAQADGIVAHESSDVEMTLNGAVKGKVIASGSCGKNVNYELYDDYTLRIFGKGAMYNYDYFFANDGVDLYSNVPWVSWTQKIKSVVIEEGITRIGSGAFIQCSSLTDVSIPNSVTSIGSYAFRECSSLKKINIPNSVTSIGSCAFYFCTSLVELNLQDGIVTIADNAFVNCSSLTHIDIPNTVTNIGERAFDGCTSLTELIIPDAVTSIGELAFANCDNLEYVKIGKGVTTINDAVFLLYHIDRNVKTVIEFTAETPVILSDVEWFGREGTNNAFADPENVIIRVPETMLDYYRSSENWSRYKESFSGYSTTDISSVDNGQSAMKVDAVYDLQGRRVTEMLPNRIYIVNGKKVYSR